jgi:pyruvate dehydrogenase E2 component (dihydrolipoamide acetyltransferase)
MPVKITMPRLTDTEPKGLIAKWLKKEGDNVRAGDPVLEVETAKVTEEVDSPASGRLYRILAPEGTEVSVSEVVGIISKPEESEEEIAEFMENERISSCATIGSIEEESMEIRSRKKRVKASPAAKILAREHGVDLASIQGTGIEGIITKRDVSKKIEQSTLSAVEAEIAEVIPLTGIRKKAAEQVTKSYANAPQLTITTEIDVTRSHKTYQEFKPKFKEEKNLKLSFLHLVIKATALALKDHTILNSIFVNGEIRVFKDINMAVAVATERGLIVPVIHRADSKTLSEIASSMEILSRKARSNKLSIEDVRGGTFTISNLGAYGVSTFTPILNPPQSAILGIGQLADKAVVVGRKIMVRKLLPISLTFDHRVVDGVPAAQLLQKLKEILEEKDLGASQSSLS